MKTHRNQTNSANLIKCEWCGTTTEYFIKMVEYMREYNDSDRKLKEVLVCKPCFKGWFII
jgi:hypothetical protein